MCQTQSGCVLLYYSCNTAEENEDLIYSSCHLPSFIQIPSVNPPAWTTMIGLPTNTTSITRLPACYLDGEVLNVISLSDRPGPMTSTLFWYNLSVTVTFIYVQCSDNPSPSPTSPIRTTLTCTTQLCVLHSLLRNRRCSAFYSRKELINSTKTLHDSPACRPLCIVYEGRYYVGVSWLVGCCKDVSCPRWRRVTQVSTLSTCVDELRHVTTHRQPTGCLDWVPSISWGVHRIPINRPVR